MVGINTNEIVKYCKKQYTCIDGWIKEGDDALLVLKGIKRDGHMHPGLKNYVVAWQQEEIEANILDSIVLKQQSSKPERMSNEIKLSECK